MNPSRLILVETDAGKRLVFLSGELVSATPELSNKVRSRQHD